MLDSASRALYLGLRRGEQMKKLTLALGALSLVLLLGCGKNKGCVEACDQAEKAAKEECAKAAGSAKEACEQSVVTKERCAEGC